MDGCGGGMVLWSLLLVVLVLGAAWFAGRAFGGGDESEESIGSAALAILEERFARGEIDRDQFEERRRTLADADATTRL